MLRFEAVQIGHKTSFFELDSITLKKGELYSLIGKNGIGKTTLFHSICNLIPLHSGQITINERPLISIKNTAKEIAFVSSKFDGIQHLTGFDYVALGRAPHTNILGQLNANDIIVVNEILSKLNIQHLSTKETLKISDGERQLLSIAKAIAQEAKLILLDEPTAFLDYANKRKILGILKSIAENQKLCIIQSSHDVELCLEFSSDLLLIDPLSKKVIQKKAAEVSLENVIEIAFKEVI